MRMTLWEFPTSYNQTAQYEQSEFCIANFTKFILFINNPLNSQDAEQCYNMNIMNLTSEH